MKKVARGFFSAKWPYLSRLLFFFFCVSSLLTPRCSSAVGSVWPCAWGRRTVRSCSSPGWWRSAMTGRCRSRCSTGGGRRRPPREGRPGSSWRWWWPGWGPGCKATSCPSPRRASREARKMETRCSTRGTVKLRGEWKSRREKLVLWRTSSTTKLCLTFH